MTVVALVLLSAQQTGATWRDQEQTAGATVTSGELKILAGGSGSYLWSDFGGTALLQNSVVQKPLTVSVVGTAKLKVSYRLQSMAATSTDLPLTFSASIVGSTAGCPSTGAPTGVVAGPWTSFPAPTVARPVTVNTSEVWCLRATVDPNAAQNKTTKVTLTFRADQQP